MEQYISKAAIVAEIERRIKHYNESAKEFGDEGYNDNVLMEQCKANACKHILSFLDTLEVKEVCLDFEQELYKAFGQIKDFTLGIAIAKRFYDMGRKHNEPVSEDLDKAVVEYMSQFLGENYYNSPWVMDSTGMTMPKELARFGAKWQKEQMMAKAIETTFNVSLPSSLYEKLWIKCCKEGDKLLVIKKDEL